MENIGRREFIAGLVGGILPIALPKAYGRECEGGVLISLPPYPLEERVLIGKKRGGKILLIGGIHGNEPGAYKTAEILKNVGVKRGSLIVAPRVNPVSILANVRGYNGDMNRKFSFISKRDPDFKNVKFIKELISEYKPDVVLSLHDGFGFHSVNKKAWGQCIVIDEECYKGFHLGKIARSVSKEVNGKIKKREWKIPLYNTHTFSENTRHPEQRKSLTYYCLTKQNVPAFCLETSKQLPYLSLKVYFHLLMLKEFFKLYNVEIEPTFDYLIGNLNRYLKPTLHYSVSLEVNGRRVLLSSYREFRLPKGSYFKVLKVNGKEGSNVVCRDVNMNLRTFSIKRRVKLTLKEDFKEIFSFRVIVS